jgi:hypothetical protein|tara:strand:+ start:2083 stop:2955 length:873 start_codon:yes stop_codon:yes gene_type:complete
MRLFTSIILTTLLLAGCNESGGDSGNSGSTKSFSLESSSEIRGNVAGDYAKASGTYTYRRPGYSTSNASVILEETNSYGGVNTIIKSTSQRVTDKSTGDISQSVSQDYYSKKNGLEYHTFTQGIDDNFYAVNALNGLADFTEFLINNGSFSTYYTYDTCSSYETEICSNRNQVATVSASYTNIGIETIETPLGRFQAYKIKAALTRTSNDTNAFSNISSSGTAWFYPSFGFVKQEFTTQFNDYSPAITMDATLTVDETNISRFSRKKAQQNHLPQLAFLRTIELPKEIIK